MEILVPNMEHGDYSEGSFKIELQSIQIKWMNLKNEYPEFKLSKRIMQKLRDLYDLVLDIT